MKTVISEDNFKTMFNLGPSCKIPHESLFKFSQMIKINSLLGYYLSSLNVDVELFRDDDTPRVFRSSLSGTVKNYGLEPIPNVADDFTVTLEDDYNSYNFGADGVPGYFQDSIDFVYDTWCSELSKAIERLSLVYGISFTLLRHDNYNAFKHFFRINRFDVTQDLLYMDSGELKNISGYECRSVIIDSHKNGYGPFVELWKNFKSMGHDGIASDLESFNNSCGNLVIDGSVSDDVARSLFSNWINSRVI